MSDKIRVKPEELEGRILEDIQRDLAETTVDEMTVPVPDIGLDVASRDNPDSLKIEWDTDTSAPKMESSVVSDETDRLRRNVSKPAETISSKGYNPNGGGSFDGEQPFDNGLKPGTSIPHTGDMGDEMGTDGSVPGSDGYDDGYDGGNGYSSGRRGNQKKKPEDKKEPEREPEKDPTKDPNKTGDKKGGQPNGEGETSGETGTPKSKTDLDKEKAEAEKKEKEEEAVDKAATNGMIANGNPNGTSGQKPAGENPEKKAEPERPQDDETGNGYGALKKQKNAGPNDNSDATARARRNLEHQNKVNNADSKPSQAKKPDKSSSSTPKTGSPIKNALLKAGNSLKNKAKGLGKKKNDSGSDSKGQDVVDKAGGAIKNALLLFMKTHPVLSMGIILVILLLIIFMIDTMEFDSSGKGRGKRSCTYSLSGVTSTGTVELSNLKVEIINCDGKADNYEVLDTVDFEKYILGVALAEAGPSSPDEALKAQMIAVRNFTLTRNSGMCPSHPESCFHGYNESTGIIRMRACTNDQVYWDYTKDCSKIERAGKPTLYCEGVDGSTDIWKKALSEERQKEVEALANSVMGEVLVDENGNVLKLGYQADETDKFIADANAGKSYVEILEGVYGSSSYSSAKCTYGGVYDYGDYTLSSENTSILHEPLDEFLEDNGTSLEEFNELIADNVDDAGWGTRAGVVAAAVTLIGELGDNYGVKVPYYWGGGHYDGVVDGALGYWGSTQCHTYANNQHYNYCGFDCSGFVPWAIKNGGFKKGVDLANNFQNMPNARKVRLTNEPQLQPGDLLESSGHIVLVVGVDEASKQYICAEAMGNAYGVLFTRRSFNESGYWGVDLEDYYNDPNYIREPIR